MSWRFLFVFLLLVAGGAAIGGMELGDWLIAHAPESIAQAASGNSKSDREVVLDANGKRFTPQPPQPRIDGTLGVPRELAPTEWTITAVSALDISRESNATQIGDDEPQELPAGGTGLPNPSGDVATVDVTSTRGTPAGPASANPAAGQPAARPGNSPQQRTPAAPAAAGVPEWLQTLRREIEVCNNLGFFQRPACVQNARNKICTPNDAWSKVPECPPRTFDRPGA
jgi:hypothetical protein